MTKLTEEPKTTNFYLPHHGVFKESLTTKLRVVFNASAPSTTGWALNSLQMVGPTIQSDLLAILIRFRHYNYILNADVEKMYRQVLMHPDDKKFQLILWRENANDELCTFQLNTVTYGTASASFLATRCLVELSKLNEEKYPLASKLIKEDFYVDDLLTGGDSIDELKVVGAHIALILNSAGFPLRKWTSNNINVIPESHTGKEVHDNVVICNDNSKPLGITWSKNDKLNFNFCFKNSSLRIHNKRNILADIAQVFDPLGLLSPATIKTKIFMQHLWKQKLSWDEPVDKQTELEWQKISSKLAHLNSITLPRKATGFNDRICVELHGFCDASEAAYGACIYLKNTSADNKVSVELLIAKTRVAPIKTLTIPKLELCGALLLAELDKKVIKSSRTVYSNSFFWTDSSIALGWINTAPNLLKIFVGNRVAEIQKLTKASNWRHIRTLDNPADIISRGIYGDELAGQSLWWHEPTWLKKQSSEWPTRQFTSREPLPELRTPRVISLITNTEFLNNYLDRYSRLRTLKRVTAWCMRFVNNCRAATNYKKHGELEPA